MKGSPTGDTNSAGRRSLSPTSFASGGRDEWLGIHAGSICANCGTSTTPLWRKDREGRIICNACGLYYKLHNSHRPVTMRMDAIKRRARYDDRRRAGTGSSEMSSGSQYGSTGPNAEDEFGDVLGGDGGIIFTPMQHHHPQQHPYPYQDPSVFAHLASLQQHNLGPQTPTPTEDPRLGRGPSYFGPGPHHQPGQFSMLPNGMHAGFPPPGRGLYNHQHHHHNHHAHSGGGSGHSLLGPDGGIHIPSTLWEHQVCPMGAWGEDCCQNLPQPPPDVQSALMATAAAVAASAPGPGPGPASMPSGGGGLAQGGESTHDSDAAAAAAAASDPLSMSAAVNALLGNGDWLVDFGGGGANGMADTPMSTTSSHGGQPPPPPPSQQQQLFDAGALSGSPNQSVVGPTYPLKRRKIGTGRGGGMEAARDARGAEGGVGGSSNTTTTRPVDASSGPAPPLPPLSRDGGGAGADSPHGGLPLSALSASSPLGGAQPQPQPQLGGTGTSASSTAGTPLPTDWWPFATSPEAVK